MRFVFAFAIKISMRPAKTTYTRSSTMSSRMEELHELPVLRNLCGCGVEKLPAPALGTDFGDARIWMCAGGTASRHRTARSDCSNSGSPGVIRSHW